MLSRPPRVARPHAAAPVALISVALAVTASASAAPGGFSVDPRSFNFGRVPVGTAPIDTATTVTVTNNTGVAQYKMSQQLTGSSGKFDVTGGNCNLISDTNPLANGASCTFELMFTADTVGSFTDNLHVEWSYNASTITSVLDIPVKARAF